MKGVMSQTKRYIALEVQAINNKTFKKEKQKKIKHNDSHNFMTNEIYTPINISNVSLTNHHIRNWYLKEVRL